MSLHKEILNKTLEIVKSKNKCNKLVSDLEITTDSETNEKIQTTLQTEEAHLMSLKEDKDKILQRVASATDKNGNIE